MIRFLGKYRGATVYEFEEFESSEGHKIGSKIVAKGVIPRQLNMTVDFVEEADTEEQAREKIKNAIDRYLDEHDMNQFEIDIL